MSRLNVVARCLPEAVSCPYFAHRELHTLGEPTRAEVEHIARSRPEPEVANAIATGRGEQRFGIEARGYFDRAGNA